jgi:pyridinium-3,5-biscarboxylic acid mononucleotide synthase
MGKNFGFCDLGFAKVDIDRERRRGFPEVIYCAGKTREQIKQISSHLLKNKQPLLLTKLDKATFSYLKKSHKRLKYNSLARIGYLISSRKRTNKPRAVIISAGTSDIPVAEEAVVTFECMGGEAVRLYDVGVAGVHRIMHNLDLIKKAPVIIVVAGMEGALASLISGLASSPVIAVPTSCGYGASFQGLSALLSMLNSCSPGVVVVNIDNGFGAGYFAALISVRQKIPQQSV